MSDNFNENMNTEQSSSETSERAKKIKAIREAMRAREQTEAEKAPPKPVQTAPEPEFELSEAEEVISDSEIELPNAEEVIPDTEGVIPDAESELPVEEEVISDGGIELPEAEDIVPEAENVLPEAEDDYSQRFAEKFRKVRENRGVVREETPQETADAPENVPENKPSTVKPLQKAKLVRNNVPAAGETAADNAEMSAVPPPVAPPKKKKKKKKKKPKTFGQRLRDLFPRKGDKPLEVTRKILFLCSIIAIIVCGYMVGDYYLDLWRSRMVYNNIADSYRTYTPIMMEVEPEDPGKYYELLPGAKKLLDINPDIIGYLTIPTIDGDPIVDLPVVQAEDNAKYLNLNVKGEESRAGALFLDWRNYFDYVIDHHLAHKNSDNLIVYGHNMADESMFGNLKYYQRNEDYYENHPIIYFNSNYEMYTYKIFAFFIVDAEDTTETKFDCWNTLDFNSEEEFYDFVNEAKRRTIRTNDIDVEYGDQLLTLSTCNTILDDRGRLIVMARRVRPGEDLYEGTKDSQPNPNIKWPSLYYEIRTNEHYDPDAPFEPYGPKKDKSSQQSTTSANTEE